MEKEDVRTIIVKKFSLGKDIFGSDIYIYRPLEIQVGFISEGIFYNDNAREYKPIEDISFIDKECDEGYYLPLTREELEKQYGLETDRDIYLFYQDFMENKVLVCYKETEDKIKVNIYDKEDLLDATNFDKKIQEELIVPLEDIKEVLKTGNIKLINEYFEKLELIKKKKEKQAKLIQKEESKKPVVNKIEKPSKPKTKVNNDLTDKQREDLAEEIIRQKKEQELAELFAKEEAAITITKKQIQAFHKELKSKVIGQDDAIDKICYVLRNNAKLEDGEPKSNILFVGPTGSGKSMIANLVAQFFKDKPVVHADANSMSTTGYVGDNIEDSLAQLMVKANGNQLIAEHGVLVIDEIDKKNTKNNDDVGGRGVLNKLLRLSEGQDYKVEYVLNNKKRTTIFNTTNLTVLACGAFPEIYEDELNEDEQIENEKIIKRNELLNEEVEIRLEEINKEKTVRNQMGFLSEKKTAEEMEKERKEIRKETEKRIRERKEELREKSREEEKQEIERIRERQKELEKEVSEKNQTLKVEPEEVAKKGKMGREFVGRYLVATLSRLSIDNLKDLMIKSKASALTREVQLLEKDDIVFDHDDKFIDVIATKAYEQGMGGRGIKNNLEEIFTTVFSKVVLNEKPEYIDEETGKIYIYGTADDEDNIQIITANGENLLEEEEPIVKEESTTKVLKL